MCYHVTWVFLNIEHLCRSVVWVCGNVLGATCRSLRALGSNLTSGPVSFILQDVYCPLFMSYYWWGVSGMSELPRRVGPSIKQNMVQKRHDLTEDDFPSAVLLRFNLEWPWVDEPRNFQRNFPKPWKSSALRSCCDQILILVIFIFIPSKTPVCIFLFIIFFFTELLEG